jgi:hypothetical protein
MPVEALFPQGRQGFRVGFLRLVAGLGYRCRWRPARLRFREPRDDVPRPRRAVILADLILDLVDEVSDELGSLCQVCPPDGMSMECC